MARRLDTQAVVSERDFTGETEIDLGTIAADAEVFRFRLARCTDDEPTLWSDPATEVTVRVLISFDRGATWEFEVGFTAPGGIHTSKDRQTPFTTLTWPWRHGRSAQAKATLGVRTGPACRTAILSTVTAREGT